MRAGPVTAARTLAFARRVLAAPSGWIEAAGDRYVLRTGPDRRSRVLGSIDEAAFRRLIESPGLRVRPAGGWMIRQLPEGAGDSAPAPGRPGLVEGSRPVMEPDAGLVLRRANLTQTPVAWLARRCGPDGRPWLEPIHVAAAMRLDADVEQAMRGPHLTLRWDALPRTRAGGSGRRGSPGETALAAARRVEAALAACGPARAMVDRICVRATALEAAERDLGLRRRTGKLLLRQGLEALARHYRLG